MFLAAGVATAAVGLGLLLGLASAGGSVVVGPLRTFAFTAALGVAVTHLLPEALGELGAPALLLFAAASVGPAWGALIRELSGAPSSHGHGRVVLGAGYAGLLVHHVGDGLGLGAYSELPGGPLAHADVLAALAVHTVPLVAVVTLAFRAHRGPRAAVERALGLAAASVGGVLLSGSVPASFTQSLSAWIAAGVAGLLLHVVTHDLGRDLPTTAVARAIDWAAAALGILTSTLGADTDLQTLRLSLLHALTTGALRSAPALALGLAAVLLLTRSHARHTHSPARPRLLAALPAPAAALDGATLAATLASIPFGICFWLGTALTTKINSLFPGHRLENTPHSPTHSDHSHATHPHATHSHSDHANATGSHSDHAHTNSDHSQSSDAPDTHASLSPIHAIASTESAPAAPIVREYIAWALTGLGLYALLSASLGRDALARLSLPVALGGAAFSGLALEIPPVAAVFVAVAAWQRGLRFEAAVAFAVMASLRAPRRVSQLLVTLVAGLAVGLAAGFFNAAVPLAPLPIPLPLGAVTLLLLSAAAVFTAWQSGIRGLFAGVFHSHDSA